MDRRTWPADAPILEVVGHERYGLDVCPGWVVRQLSVREGTQAYAARKDGCLAEYFPDPCHAVLQAADVATQAFNAYEAARMKEAAHR